MFIVLYRAGGAGSRLRKYTIGPYGRITLHQARAAALRIFAARTEGRDPATEKQQARRRLVADRVDDVIELFISEHVSKNRSAGEISRLLRREVIPKWATRSVHEIGKRQVIDLGWKSLRGAHLQLPISSSKCRRPSSDGVSDALFWTLLQLRNRGTCTGEGA